MRRRALAFRLVKFDILDLDLKPFETSSRQWRLSTVSRGPLLVQYPNEVRIWVQGIEQRFRFDVVDGFIGA